jgi:hypothetical protein
MCSNNFCSYKAIFGIWLFQKVYFYLFSKEKVKWITHIQRWTSCSMCNSFLCNDVISCWRGDTYVDLQTQYTSTSSISILCHKHWSRYCPCAGMSIASWIVTTYNALTRNDCTMWVMDMNFLPEWWIANDDTICKWSI